MPTVSGSPLANLGCKVAASAFPVFFLRFGLRAPTRPFHPGHRGWGQSDRGTTAALPKHRPGWPPSPRQRIPWVLGGLFNLGWRMASHEYPRTRPIETCPLHPKANNPGATGSTPCRSCHHCYPRGLVVHSGGKTGLAPGLDVPGSLCCFSGLLRNLGPAA